MVENTLPETIRLLEVAIDGRQSGQLVHQSQFEYRYARAGADQPAVGLLMPPDRLTWHDGALFPVMDQNLPEGTPGPGLRADSLGKRQHWRAILIGYVQSTLPA
ncbi:MAG: HipA N-terminal domain-containing protein [Xanthomonadales bacterium]|nr:HipA N-terminal domain-containing protein [Xanthomonadales bacterium]